MKTVIMLITAFVLLLNSMQVSKSFMKNVEEMFEEANAQELQYCLNEI